MIACLIVAFIIFAAVPILPPAVSIAAPSVRSSLLFCDVGGFCVATYLV